MTDRSEMTWVENQLNQCSLILTELCEVEQNRFALSFYLVLYSVSNEYSANAESKTGRCMLTDQVVAAQVE